MDVLLVVECVVKRYQHNDYSPVSQPLDWWFERQLEDCEDCYYSCQREEDACIRCGAAILTKVERVQVLPATDFDTGTECCE